jgi:ATPase subunit of ABC transporter with duplicated ATPase domains
MYTIYIVPSGDEDTDKVLKNLIPGERVINNPSSMNNFTFYLRLSNDVDVILENFLQKYKGAFLLISHDREFLKRTTDYTAEIELGEMTKFPGHIDDYFEQKRELQGLLAAQAKNQDLKRKQIQEFVDRFKAKASKARQAQSRMKMLDKMEIIETKELPVRAQIQIPKPIEVSYERDYQNLEKLGLEKFLEKPSD